MEYGFGIFGANGEDFSGLQFRRNEFDGTETTDILIDYDGIVNGSVRRHVSNANNCFEYDTPDIVANPSYTETFYYYCDLSPSADDCVVPRDNLSDLGSNNYYLRHSDQYICGPIDVPIAPPYTDQALDDLRDSIILYETALINTPTSPTLQMRLANLNEIKDIVYYSLLVDAAKSKNWTSASGLLRDEGDYTAKKLLYGLYLEQEEWETAQDFLADSLPKGSQDEQWFIEVQEINVQRLEEGEEFSLSQNQEELLYEVSESSSRERAHARSLLMLLKGERFEVGFNGDSGVVEPRSSKAGARNTDSILVYPNPADDIVTMDLPKVISRLTILAIDGTTCYAENIDSRSENRLHSVDISALPQGIYILQFWSGEKMKYSARIAIMR